MEEQVLQILKDILDNENIDQNVSQENCVEWDSMAHLNIIMVVEEMFDVDIEPDDIIAITSFDQLLKYIKQTKK